MPHLQAALLAINAAQGELADVIEHGAADSPQGASGAEVAQQLTSLIEVIMQLPAPASEGDRQMRLQTLVLLRDLGPSLIQHRMRQGRAAQVSIRPCRGDPVLTTVALWQERFTILMSHYSSSALHSCCCVGFVLPATQQLPVRRESALPHLLLI